MQSMTQSSVSVSPLLTRIVTGLLLAAGLFAVLFFAPRAAWQTILVISFLLAFYELLKMGKGSGPQVKTLHQKQMRINHLAFAILYLGIPFYFIFGLTQNANYQFWFLLCIVSTGLGDTFAYFTGRSFGKHKLAPVISPNKTWEGAFGALLGGAVGSVVLHQIYQRPEYLWQQILLGMVLAVIGIYGDLAESAIKRAFGVKDSGNILPGHGGVLDRIDAYLFTLPAIYFYSQWITK